MVGVIRDIRRDYNGKDCRDSTAVHKTGFIREWWENKDEVTLITRPRRFGKTLNMNMLERFLSVEYKNNGEIFEGLSIWEDEKYQKIQGTYPVIFLSFAVPGKGKDLYGYTKII